MRSPINDESLVMRVRASNLAHLFRLRLLILGKQLVGKGALGQVSRGRAIQAKQWVSF